MSSKPPPAARARQAQKAATRATLRAAARRCFAERGFAATQIGDIARAAGVAHGTFYVHFASKEQVCDELLDELNQALVGELDAAWGPAALADPTRTARRLAEICLDRWRADRDLVAAFAERAGLDGRLEPLRDGINPPVARFLGARIATLAAAVGAKVRQPELIAHALLGMWTRVGLQYLFGTGVSRKQAAELLATLSIGALGAAVPELGRALARSPAPR